ncbi:DUF2490 domain-containing protein [Cytophagaceae bacterium ABcell3]|nr:DUF2490 domain-containing protein [Cytophagaceae bacterium ABcell3]
MNSAQNDVVDREYIPHYQFWGTLELSQQISQRFSLDMDYHYRRQNSERNRLNIFEMPRWQGLRLWVNFYLSDRVRIILSPFLLSNQVPTSYEEDIREQWINEYRLTARVDYFSRLGTVDIMHRYGFERRQRWDYLERRWHEYRVRYMLRFRFPLKFLSDNTKFTVQNETMINLGRFIANYNLFDQNRFYAGIEQKVADRIFITSAYLFSVEQIPFVDDFAVIHAISVTITAQNLFGKALLSSD